MYNGNLSKSTQLQTAYIKAVGNQNHALGNYLAGLNGANASMGGYIKSLIGAKAATIGLQVASVALNATITMGISLAISALVTQIQKWANAQEDVRKKSVELTNSYKEQQSSLESQIEKYKELKDTLDDGNLSTDEARSIKEQLLEIQQSLIESYGNEASNIDLVNGKYREQLGLLGELSKEKATEYVTENRDVFADAKEALEKERTYNLGTVTSWNDYSPQTEDQKKLLDYIEAYSELLDLTYTGATGYGVSATSVSVSVKADVTSADELMHQFATDLEKYGEENDIDVSGILEGISGQLKETWTDELTEYKTVYDEFMKAEIVRNDTLRPLYQESIQAVEDYNKALSTGEGIEEAKANLESVQQSVQSATGELEGSQGIFDGIYEGINKDAEAAYNLGNAFENDKTVQNYAEQLRGLTDVDLKAISFDNTNTEKGEEAFKGLMETLGLTEEQVQSLIDKLVELGYVQGKVQGSTLDDEITVFKSFDGSIIGERLQHITEEFENGSLSHKEYFDALQSEIDNVDFSNYTNSIEDANEASQQFFTDSIQQVASGLSGLINDFDSGNMSISEYLEGYLSIGNTLSTLTDNLQENSSAWNENGEAISDSMSSALDNTQSQLQTAMTTIESYQDSIYSLEQILTNSVKEGTDEFTAHTNVIAQDLYNIVQTGGIMADEIKNTLGTTTAEIAKSLTENVSNQELACQAIMGNTNTAIQNMATAIGELFDTLGKQISNFKVDLNFGIKSIDWKKVDIFGKEFSLPEIKFELGASGESLQSIGDAVSSFGKTVASNFTPQTIELEDFHFSTTENGKNDDYSPSSGVLKNYEDALDKVKDGSKSAKNQFEETVDFFEERIEELNNALDLLKSNLENVVGSFAKNTLIDAEIGINAEKINNYTDALAMYTEKANEALSKLPSDIADKVQNGAVALDTFIGSGNEQIVENIKEYDKWSDSIHECKLRLAELQQELEDLELAKFTNVIEDFNNQFDIRENSKDLLDKQIDLFKEAGLLVGTSLYDAQLSQSKKQLELLEQEKAKLVEQMNSALASGRVNLCPVV